MATRRPRRRDEEPGRRGRLHRDRLGTGRLTPTLGGRRSPRCTPSSTPTTPPRRARSSATCLDHTVVDDGDGWLIFKLPPAELGVHPTEVARRPATDTMRLSLMCDDVEATSRGARCTRGSSSSLRSSDKGYGIVTTLRVARRRHARALPAAAHDRPRPRGLSRAAPTPATSLAAALVVAASRRAPPPGAARAADREPPPPLRVIVEPAAGYGFVSRRHRRRAPLGARGDVRARRPDDRGGPRGRASAATSPSRSSSTRTTTRAR